MSRIIVVVVGALAAAVMCANADPRLLADMHEFKVLPTATIVDSPDTVGFADSNLTRLSSHAEIDKELDMMQSIGVTDIRIGVFWSEIEPIEGRFNWANTDYVIQQAKARGMGVLAVLNQTPAWAGTPIGAGMPDPTDFADFATTVAQRYKGDISAVEIWNEPNAAFFLNPVSPSNYTLLLKAGYAAIKAVDPSITVIGGVLGAGLTLGNATMNPVDFLQGMYAAGAAGYFDALSFHPYKYDVLFSEGDTVLVSPLKQFQAMRALMDQMGDAAKKIWATEYGLPTDSNDDHYLSQEQQAEYIADFLNSWGEQAGTGPMFIYTTRDKNTGSTDDQDNFGVWETDWTPKLAVQVIADFIAGHALPPGNPIIDAIKNLIVKGAQFIGSVIRGVVNVAVGVAKAIAAGIAWFAKTVVTVTKKIVNAVVNVAGKVIDGIRSLVQRGADAIRDLVDRIVNRTPASALGTNSTVALRVTSAKLTANPLAVTGSVAAVRAKSSPAEGKSAEKVGRRTPGTVKEPADIEARAGTREAKGATAKATRPDPATTVSAGTDSTTTGPTTADSTTTADGQKSAKSKPVRSGLSKKPNAGPRSNKAHAAAGTD